MILHNSKPAEKGMYDLNCTEYVLGSLGIPFSAFPEVCVDIVCANI